MRLFGTDLELIQSEGGKITPDSIPRMISRAKEIGQQTDAYWTQQFTNKDAVEGYRKLGREILAQIHRPVDVFCGAVRAAATITGVAMELK